MQFTFCKETGKQTIKQLSKARLSLVKSASARWQDNFFDTIEQLKQVGLVIASHRDCISTYTSKTHINRYLKKRRQDGKNGVPDSKKSRRSSETAFDFSTNSLFCGKRRQEKDSKHPDCWRKYYIVQFKYATAWIPFKDFILSICSLFID